MFPTWTPTATKAYSTDLVGSTGDVPFDPMNLSTPADAANMLIEISPFYADAASLEILSVSSGKITGQPPVVFPVPDPEGRDALFIVVHAKPGMNDRNLNVGQLLMFKYKKGMGAPYYWTAGKDEPAAEPGLHVVTIHDIECNYGSAPAAAPAPPPLESTTASLVSDMVAVKKAISAQALQLNILQTAKPA